PAPFNASTYETVWNLYKKFVTPAGESFTIEQYKVRLHMHRRPAPEAPESVTTTTAPSANETVPPTAESNDAETVPTAAAAMPNLTSKAKTCIPNKTENYRTLGYQLLNFRQPNLARNFLVLSKLGYFD